MKIKVNIKENIGMKLHIIKSNQNKESRTINIYLFS